MAFSGYGERRLRCVMPFEALPGEVRLLRRAVRSALGQWGAQQAVDEAEVVVTELATNVIKHVGEGLRRPSFWKRTTVGSGWSCTI